MTAPLVIAIIRANFAADGSGGRTFEEEVLRAALTSPVQHRLVVYPSTPSLVGAIDALGIAHRVSVLELLEAPGLPERVVGKAMRVLTRDAGPKPFAALSEALIKQGVHCAWTLGGTLSPLDIPYIGTIWDLQHRVQPWFPEVSSDGEWRERERLYSEFTRRATGLLVGTAIGAAEVRDAYGDAQGALHVMPLPTPSFALAAGQAPARPRIDELSEPYLVYPAHFWAHKNHLTALRVLVDTAEMPDAPSLVLVGSDKGNREHVMSMARSLGVEHRVRAMGFVEQDKLVSLYQHADALIFPSLFGPDNLPPLEAMALGCPVIAARVPGAEEQLGDAAILVEPMAASEYAAAVRTLRFDAARRDALVAAGYARARSWTTQNYADAVFALIERRIAPVRELWA